MKSSALKRIVTTRRNLSSAERKDFAYLLGVYLRNSSRTRNDLRSLERVVREPEIIERISTAATNLGSHQPKISSNGIRIYDTNLVRVLHLGCYRYFDYFVSEDSEMVNFGQGFVDISQAKVLPEGATMSYKFMCTNEVDRKIFLRVLLELGVYARLQHQFVMIGGVSNLARFSALNLDAHRPDNRERIQAYLQKHSSLPHNLEEYYGVRRRVKHLVGINSEINFEIAAQELGIGRGTLWQWVKDIVDPKKCSLGQKPRGVCSYERLCDYLGVPNVLAAERAVARGGTLFIPVNGELYFVPRTVLKESTVVVRDGKGYSELEEQLNLFLQQEEDRKLDFTFNGNEVIGVKYHNNRSLSSSQPSQPTGYRLSLSSSHITFENITISVGGQSYLWDARLQAKYFKIYETTPEPINHDHLEHVRSELDAYLAHKTRDMDFKLKDGCILDLSLRNGFKGANRSPLIRNIPENE